MKTKALLSIAFAALVTLSFSFASSTTNTSDEVVTESRSSRYDHQADEPIGGFIAEDKF